MTNTRHPCPLCENSRKLFTPQGLKQHLTKVHNEPRENQKTTIQVSLELHRYLSNRKQWGETFDAELKRLLKVDEGDS